MPTFSPWGTGSTPWPRRRPVTEFVIAQLSRGSNPRLSPGVPTRSPLRRVRRGFLVVPCSAAVPSSVPPCGPPRCCSRRSPLRRLPACTVHGGVPPGNRVRTRRPVRLGAGVPQRHLHDPLRQRHRLHHGQPVPERELPRRRLPRLVARDDLHGQQPVPVGQVQRRAVLREPPRWLLPGHRGLHGQHHLRHQPDHTPAAEPAPPVQNNNKCVSGRCRNGYCVRIDGRMPGQGFRPTGP